MYRATHTHELARRHFHQCFAGQRVFDDEGPCEPPSPDVSDVSLGLHHFIELPALDFLWCPDLVLAPFPVIALVMATWDAPQMQHER